MGARAQSGVPEKRREVLGVRGGAAYGCGLWVFFFFQAEDGIRDLIVTGVQTCALPISFFVAGVPGLLLAALTLRLWEPPRGAHDEAAPPRSPGARDALAALLRNRTYALTVLGYAAYTFALGGIAFWIPSFLERVREIPRGPAPWRLGASRCV